MTLNFLRRRIVVLIYVLLIMVISACSGQENQPEAAASIQPEPDAETTETEIPAAATEDVPTATATEMPEPSTPTLEPTPTEAIPPTPTVPPVTINGLPAEQFIIMTDETRNHVREIYANGQDLGRDANVFSILGDSLIATPQSLAKWDGEDYTLGEYDYLQPTLDQFGGSFSRYGASVRVGLHSWSVFDPLWADKEYCLANEDVLACEIRLDNPSFMFIFLGSNDAGSPGGFNVNYRQIVETLIEEGIVPILATKADRFEGGDNVNNNIIREIAADFQVPLLEFDILADTLPGRGLSSDNVHLTYLEPLDYGSADIFSVGYPVHNLASLMILDEVSREASGNGEK
jgi:hypothetical protein